jgi:phosphatidylserine decarboxylase
MVHRRPSSQLSEDTEIDYKVYRSLLAFFIDNLNAFTRAHQACIPDLDEQPRIRVTLE